MRAVVRSLVPMLALAVLTSDLLAQGVPDTQPGMLTIFVEQLKVGMDSDHESNEAGWPAAFARANYPYTYLALSSMTGPAEVWFISPYDNYAAEGESMKMVEDDPALAAELSRLWRADGEYLANAYQIQAMARPDLSYGEFPDLGLARFWDITTFRVRLGHEQAWEEAARVYMQNVQQHAPGMSYRIYQVTAGLPGANYMIFSSVNSYADFDQAMAEGMAMMQNVSQEDMATLQNFMQTGVQNVITNRYQLSPTMSYVDEATKARDPAFWNRR
jgi:hypothetical protein